MQRYSSTSSKYNSWNLSLRNNLENFPLYNTYTHTCTHAQINTLQLLFQHCYWLWRGQYLGVQVHVCQCQLIMCSRQREQLLGLRLPAELPHTPSHHTLEISTAGVRLCMYVRWSIVMNYHVLWNFSNLTTW